jgi:hypothetical protein
MSTGPNDSKLWTVVSLLAALVAAATARKALHATWRATTGKEPPSNPADPDLNLREAITWAAVSGTLIAVARMLATRRAAHYFLRSTGNNPLA